MNNPVLTTIHNRHSIRQFLDTKLSDEQIQTLLTAANQAPSAHNQQSWEFLIVMDDKKEGLAKLVAESAANFPKPSSAILRMAAKSISSAPVVIAIKNTGDLISHGTETFHIEEQQCYDFFRLMEIQSSAAATENLLLAATSMGLGSVWLGILYLIKDEVLHFLGEENGEFMAVVPVGYPKKTSTGPKKKDLGAVIKISR